MSCDISIFAKEAFLNINPHEPFRLRTKPLRGGHLQRVSSIIRGDQITDKIGAKFNPTSGYENDVCIYVKPQVQKGDDFKFEGKKAYIDLIDGHNLGQLAEKHPEVGVIVCSQIDKETMSKCINNELVVIPQHHCNFDREVRTRRGITTIGVIGTAGAFDFLPKDLEYQLNERGIVLYKYSRFFSRQDIINFYKNIDIQLVWRPYKKLLSNPLKIVNASSFGVPTIALDELAFEEVDGCYLPVNTFEELLSSLDSMIDHPDLYKELSTNCLEKSENYHIDKIAEMYLKLLS